MPVCAFAGSNTVAPPHADLRGVDVAPTLSPLLTFKVSRSIGGSSEASTQ
jgi:hypothetical protein